MPRHPHALTLVLALVAAVLAGVGAPAATAAPTPCTVTFTKAFASGEAKIGAAPSPTPEEPDPRWWGIYEVPVTDPRTVVDVDYAFDLVMSDASGLNIFQSSREGREGEFLPPTSQAFERGDVTGRLDGRYTFDDEAPGGRLTGSNPTPGRYVPRVAASRIEGVVGSPGKWLVWVNNHGPGSGYFRSLSLTLTFSTCDSDGDGVEDSVDNCRDMPNPDQANNDDDSVGSACDIDDDNDGTDDVDDPCPVAAGPRGCPGASRTAKLAHKAKARRLVVTIRSATPACRTARVVVHRVRKGKDPRAASGRTNAKGVLKVKAPKKPGRYYAKVAPSVVAGVAECRGAMTKRITVRRR